MSDTDSRGSLPAASGAPLLRATIRRAPEHFRVEELAGFEPSGQGEHLLLEVEKRGMTTAFAAKRLAAWAGVPLPAVAYAGLKDRHAVTRQRFSVHLPKRVSPPVDALASDDFRVLDARWHARKLPRGALAGNRFELLLTDVERLTDDEQAIDARLQQLATGGVPNYFGEQRFGRTGDNIDQARRMFAGARLPREQRGILLSAVRSELFNRVLATRIEQRSWATGVDGDVWMLDGSHSVFGPEPLDPSLQQRAAEIDIHPTGPLWGAGSLRSADVARALEEQVLAPFGELRDGLEAAGLKQERRALRIRVGALQWQWLAEGNLQLRFELPPGAYATVLLAELGRVVDLQRPG